MALPLVEVPGRAYHVLGGPTLIITTTTVGAADLKRSLIDLGAYVVK